MSEASVKTMAHASAGISVPKDGTVQFSSSGRNENCHAFHVVNVHRNATNNKAPIGIDAHATSIIAVALRLRSMP